MKKTILNLGKALSKAEQKLINGGYMFPDCEEPLVHCVSTFGQIVCCDPNIP